MQLLHQVYQRDTVRCMFTSMYALSHTHTHTHTHTQANWTVVSTGENSVTMQHVSPSGDQDYPGRLTVCVTYQLTDRNEVLIDYTAKTDATTIVNMTNHTYFNLAGRVSLMCYLSLSLSLSLCVCVCSSLYLYSRHFVTRWKLFHPSTKNFQRITHFVNVTNEEKGLSTFVNSTKRDQSHTVLLDSCCVLFYPQGTILDHVLTINGAEYTPLDDELIAIGTLESVKGTPLDFTSPTPIGQRINVVGGYDINYNLLGIKSTYPSDASLRHCAT